MYAFIFYNLGLGFEIVVIKVDDLEKKSNKDYLMIWYGKERKKVLTLS